MTNQQRIEAAFRLMDGHEWDKLDSFQHPTCENRFNADAFPNRDAFVAMCKGWYSAFPDLKHDIIDFIDGGDRVAYTVRVTGTHTAPFHSPKGTVPATGKRIDFRAADVVKLGLDGRATSWHVFTDTIEFMKQLGLA